MEILSAKKKKSFSVWKIKADIGFDLCTICIY